LLPIKRSENFYQMRGRKKFRGKGVEKNWEEKEKEEP
jgi:hypothetical protein